MEELNNKLNKIQSELKAPKSQYNKFAGFYYRNCEDILEALKPLLKEHKLTIQVSDDVVEVGGRIYVKATAKLSDGTNSIQTTAFARESEEKKGMDSSQLTGATSSYARKYALNGLFAIDDTKDADSHEKPAEAPKKPQTAKPVVDELTKAKAELNTMLKEAGHDNPVKMKLYITKVLRKSTIDTVFEANEVMQALEDGTV